MVDSALLVIAGAIYSNSTGKNIQKGLINYSMDLQILKALEQIYLNLVTATEVIESLMP